jgi:hypothetical protein
VNFTDDSFFVSHQDDGQIQKFCVADNSTPAFTPVYDLGEGSWKFNLRIIEITNNFSHSKAIETKLLLQLDGWMEN